jgi:hypothetical protein
MDEVKQTLYAEAVLGKDAEDFFKSDIGRYVLAESQRIVDDAVGVLKVIAATDHARIMALQLKIGCAEGAVQWLKDMIMAGNQALQSLEQIEDEEE